MADIPELSERLVAQTGGTKAKPLKIDEPYLHTHPKTRVLYYRHGFPERLRPHIPGNLTELKVSLGSKSVLTPGLAEQFWEAAREYELLYTRAVKLKNGAFDSLDPVAITFLSEAYRAEALDNDHNSRWDTSEREVYQDVADQLAAAGVDYASHWRGREGQRWALKARETTEASLAEMKSMRASGDLQAIVDWWREEAMAKGRTFREIVQTMLDNPRYTIGIPTRAQVSTALRYLNDVLGDPRPEEITRAEVTRWLDMIARRPAFVSAEERVMPLGDLVALYGDKEVQRASEGTLQKHCRVLSKRWSHAAQEGLISEFLSNPFSGRTFELPSASERAATGFSKTELQGIFSLPFFNSGPMPRWGRGEAAYWLPLLALFTGARPEEVAQLVLSDIFKDAGTGRTVLGFIGLSDHPEKGKQRLKTKEKGTGPRIFPIPEGLISLGFLDYVEWLKSHGEEALFPQLRVRNKFNRLYPSFGDKWCEAIYTNGILQRRSGRQPMREFRHTLVTGARVSLIPEAAIGYLIGHATTGEHQPRMTGRYGQLGPHAVWIDKYRPLIDVLELVKPWSPPW